MTPTSTPSHFSGFWSFYVRVETQGRCGVAHAELEREAMQREDAYMRRMKGGLKQRGMLGHSSGRPLPEDDEPEMVRVCAHSLHVHTSRAGISRSLATVGNHQAWQPPWQPPSAW